MSDEQELIVIAEIDPAKIFQGEGLNELLEVVRSAVIKYHTNVSTAVGRAALKALAYKIARAKTKLDDLGKNHVAKEKAKVKKIDIHRKIAKDFLTELQASTRKPLTDWEHAEEKRLEDIKDRIGAITNLAPTEASQIGFLGLDKLMDRLKFVIDYPIDEDFEELTPVARIAKEDAIRSLTETVARVKKQVEDQAELDKLRKASAEREKKDAEDAAAKEATVEAERVAEVEKQKVIDDKNAAEQRARDAEAETQRKVDLAKQQERDKIEAERKADEELARVRANNTRHKGKIHRDIVICLQKIEVGGSLMTEKDAKKVVTAMAKGDLTHVQINY